MKVRHDVHGVGVEFDDGTSVDFVNKRRLVWNTKTIRREGRKTVFDMIVGNSAISKSTYTSISFYGDSFTWLIDSGEFGGSSFQGDHVRTNWIML